VRTLWRISKHNDLEGVGGEKTDGRWHTMGKGKRIVYLSEHPALALIEVLVNLTENPDFIPKSYQLLKIKVDDSISTEAHVPAILTNDWKTNFKETQMIGDTWLESFSSALLVVPSAPSPASMNFLLNPLHPDAKNIAIEWCKWFDYDDRFFRIHE